MAPKDDQLYDPAPPIPTYDEAIAGSSQPSTGLHSPSPYDDPANAQFESDRLLGTRDASSDPNGGTQSSARPTRRPGGYRPPTVESEDEYTDSEADEGEDRHVRREMEELEIDDGASTRSSLWAKRMPFSLSLPKWSWRWRLPRLPSIRLGERSTPAGEGDERPRWRCSPSLASAATLLMIARIFAILMVMGFLYLLFMSDIFSNMARRLGGGQMFDPESVRIHVQGSVDKDRLRDNLKHFTSYAHLAGSEGDYALATDTKNMFVQYGLEDVTVNSPSSSVLVPCGIVGRVSEVSEVSLDSSIHSVVSPRTSPRAFIHGGALGEPSSKDLRNCSCALETSLFRHLLT